MSARLRPPHARLPSTRVTTPSVGAYRFRPTNDRRARPASTSAGPAAASPKGTTVPAAANANPMSYLGKSGKQRVAVVAGATLVSYALP